jgi:hypothetical protein
MIMARHASKRGPAALLPTERNAGGRRNDDSSLNPGRVESPVIFASSRAFAASLFVSRCYFSAKLTSS